MSQVKRGLRVHLHQDQVPYSLHEVIHSRLNALAWAAMLKGMNRPGPALPVPVQIICMVLTVAILMGIGWVIHPLIGDGVHWLSDNYGSSGIAFGYVGLFGGLGLFAWWAMRREKRLIAAGLIAPPPPLPPAPRWMKAARWIMGTLIAVGILAGLLEGILK